VEIARRYLPQGHKTTETLNQVLSTASKQVTALQVKTDKRKERAKSQSGVRGYIQNLRKRVTGTTPNKKRVATHMETQPKMEMGKWDEEVETGQRTESIEVESVNAALGSGLDQHSTHIPTVDPTPAEMVTTSFLLTPQDPA
jgi:hypothetical protein